MKVQDLFEAKRVATDKGYYTPGYDEEDKNIRGTVKDWMARLGATPADIAAAVAQAKELGSFSKLAQFHKSTAAEQKNGTFVFKKPMGDERRDERYSVYANGQIRSSSIGTFGKVVPTRLKAPKPRLVAGDAVKSLVKIFDGAFKELASKMDKRVAKKVDEAKAPSGAMYKIKWKGYPGNPKPETHDISYFSDDMGFDKTDIDSIVALAVGEEYVTGGPRDSVIVSRTK